MVVIWFSPAVHSVAARKMPLRFTTSCPDPWLPAMSWQFEMKLGQPTPMHRPVVVFPSSTVKKKRPACFWIPLTPFLSISFVLIVAVGAEGSKIEMRRPRVWRKAEEHIVCPVASGCSASCHANWEPIQFPEPKAHRKTPRVGLGINNWLVVGPPL